jgi:hypothetical protein
VPAPRPPSTCRAKATLASPHTCLTLSLVRRGMPRPMRQRITYKPTPTTRDPPREECHHSPSPETKFSGSRVLVAAATFGHQKDFEVFHLVHIRDVPAQTRVLFKSLTHQRAATFVVRRVHSCMYAPRERAARHPRHSCRAGVSLRAAPRRATRTPLSYHLRAGCCPPLYSLVVY